LSATAYAQQLQQKNYNISKVNILETVIGWLAPPVCMGCGSEGETLCAFCSASEIIPFGERCWRCNALSLRSRTCVSCSRNGSPRHVWVTTDYNGIAKEVVQKYKFGHQRIASRAIAKLMAETFLLFNSPEDIAANNYVLASVPTATSRVRERGFDHAALLAESIARQLGLPSSKILGRIGQSRQVGTTRSERIKQAEGKYFVRKPEIVSGRNILLIDDVITTGATVQEVAKTLRKSGARTIDALVFAKRL
jgi:competence protein ComFC